MSVEIDAGSNDGLTCASHSTASRLPARYPAWPQHHHRRSVMDRATAIEGARHDAPPNRLKQCILVSTRLRL